MHRSSAWLTYISADTIAKQKQYVQTQTAALSRDPELFKKVYKHAFVANKEKGAKALPLENAIVYWDLIFKAPGPQWRTASTDWSALWAEYLTAKFTKTVNKDMWNQTLEFYKKSMQDETLSFWSEDGAWPGVIDDFVAYAKVKRGDVPETMETD
jgi:DCN1-like protein 1/2